MFAIISSFLPVSLFIKDEPVSVVLQDEEGGEVHFTVGTQEDATISWAELIDMSSKDLKEQDYLKSESECLGVLGDRMMMETGRLNKAGEVYLEAFSLLTLDEEGLITMVEAFSDVHSGTLVGAAADKAEK